MRSRHQNGSSISATPTDAAEADPSAKTPKGRETAPTSPPSPAPSAAAPDARKRILLVDDHAVVRFGISQLINRQTDLVVCGEEEDASKALDAITALKPDLVI